MDTQKVTDNGNASVDNGGEQVSSDCEDNNSKDGSSHSKGKQVMEGNGGSDTPLSSSHCGFSKKRGLSDVISKLRNNQQSDVKQEKREMDEFVNEAYEANQNESDLNDEDGEYEYQNQNGK